jgi:hypothetical protein
MGFIVVFPYTDTMYYDYIHLILPFLFSSPLFLKIILMNFIMTYFFFFLPFSYQEYGKAPGFERNRMDPPNTGKTLSYSLPELP